MAQAAKRTRRTPALPKERASTRDRLQDPPFSFLFRFRDLIAPTIEAHSDIISEHGTCWWGWWKRPLEDSRLKIWEELERQTQTLQGPIPIGLFDSGTDRIYVATIDKVLPPNVSGDDCLPVPLPKAEQKLVPKYYRDSPFSRAWLRITKITPFAQKLFGEWSYAEPPPLPNYSSSLLERLRGKVISDGGELRAMDTTIWRVRPKKAGDKEETVIAAAAGPASAISATPVLSHGEYILHITDPHFSLGPHRSKHIWRLESEKDDGRPTLAQQILSAIGTRKIGFIVISGDLTFAATEAEFDASYSFIWTLLGRLGLGREHVIIVPGNHDISWTKTEKYSEGATLEVAPEAATLNYRNFYQKLLSHQPHVNLCMGRRYVLSGTFVVDVCALNSTSLATGKEFLAGLGRVEQRAFEDIKEGLGWTEDAGLALRLLVLHHHLVPIENRAHEAEYYHGFGMAVDAPRIQRLAASTGVRMTLHGHRHQPFLWQSEVYELPNVDLLGRSHGRMTIIGGGTAGSVDTPDQFVHFNLIRLSSEAIEIHPFRSHATGAFDPTPIWRAPLLLDGTPRRLTVGTWSRETTTKK